jgi:hypothetical protein
VSGLPAGNLPPGFDYIDLIELLDLLEAFLEYPRIGTQDEQEGEREVWDRARTLLARYRAATV